MQPYNRKPPPPKKFFCDFWMIPCSRCPPALLQKVEPTRRGRGRPRTINRDISVNNIEKFASQKGSKSMRKPPLPTKQTSDSRAWNLMSNECLDSSYFKSHVIKMQHGKPRGRKSKNTSILSITPMSTDITHMPLKNGENIEIKFPKMTPMSKKPTNNQGQKLHSAASSRPTVIYFKAPKSYTNSCPNGMEVKQSIINQRNLTCDQQLGVSFKDFRNAIHLRRKYGNFIDDATFEYVYELQIIKPDNLLIHFFSQTSKTISDQIVQNTPLQSEVSELQSTPDDSFFSCGQVIVDSIRMLYDEESVLGYA
ncbi:uncharacterized protein NPIL_261421 [Nephila pilipes]|uniref:Uncharacterized protein n=1 Tax=Nephila pilipes TaxID=299642 RepID=A0A8X6IJG7_NEPPI|nr:uncharacterized protein NPIL_261421 [Nephila pilipes]